jgi:adenylate kinase family enzyme
MLKTIYSRRSDIFIKRWPQAPRVVFFAAPNSFQNELIQRFAIDLGLPVVSMKNQMANIQQLAGKDS